MTKAIFRSAVDYLSAIFSLSFGQPSCRRARSGVYGPFVDFPFVYAPKNRAKSLSVAAVLILSIAVVDWATKPYVSLGLLYLFPIMLAGGFLSRLQILA